MVMQKSKAKYASLVLMLCALLGTAAATAAEEEKGEKGEQSRAEMQRKLEDAQRRLDTAAREVADISMLMSDDVMPDVMQLRTMNGQHAVLGVNIGSGRNAGRDDGVEVMSVSPGGAAAEAGLKAGDVLTEVNGKALKRSGDESPRSQLLAQMREIEPGQKVTVKYLRDGKPGSATVVARELPDRIFNMRVPGPGAMPGLPNFVFTRAAGVFGAAELVPLTPKLGQYFGSDKGLLVVRAPADSRLKLEEGDVIVDIDGRVPSSPSHALQILSSYQAGEKLRLNVLRMKKRITFDITIPEDAEEGRGFRFQSDDVLMPAPMGAPLPPLPPMEPPQQMRKQSKIIVSGDERI